MTVLVFISCSLLVFGPIFVISKASVLNKVKYKNYFLFGFISNLVWNISKLFILGSIYPFYDLEIYDPIQEFIKTIGRIIEIIIIYYSLGYLLKSNSNISKHRVIILAYSLGWYTTESVITQLLPLVNTLSVEFSWMYTHSAIESNIKLLEQISLNTCIYLYFINHHQYLINNNNNKSTTSKNKYNQNHHHHHHHHNNNNKYQLKQHHQSIILLNILLIAYILFEAISSFIFHVVPFHGLLILKSLYSFLFFQIVKI